MSDMKDFINKMMEIGAGHDQAASEMERAKWIEEAEQAYKLHVYKLIKANVITAGDSKLDLCGVSKLLPPLDDENSRANVFSDKKYLDRMKKHGGNCC